ncbi:MAG TPA: hotdog fold domain-containing protein [Solirubrobacteraceae bacterium]|nr:hotdog fold domain-containing protein [Solirubrobacteraceae bacterium]
MASASPLMRLHRRLSPLPLGGTLFSLAYQAAAPYFLTIPARVQEVAPGRARARMAQRPWVRNHLGTVHAIALCNLAEFVMGACAEATVPDSHRWIPKGMTVAYLAKARGTMHATAVLDLPPALSDRQEATVEISVDDDAGTTVFTAQIRIWITATSPKEAP